MGVPSGTMVALRACYTLGVRRRIKQARRRWFPDGMVTAGKTPSPSRDAGGVVPDGSGDFLVVVSECRHPDILICIIKRGVGES